jgi:hypothetical protein
MTYNEFLNQVAVVRNKGDTDAVSKSSSSSAAAAV